MSIQVVKWENWFHVGDITKKEKKRSFEGSGLSVSMNPDAWRKIARLNGETYLVHKKSPLFLDIHALSLEKRKSIFNWGIIEGYLTEGEKWVYRYDDEDEPMYMSFLSYEDWLKHMGLDPNDSLDQEEISKSDITRVTCFLGTDKLYQEAGWDLGNEPSLAETFCILRYADEVLEIDGVYWSDILDVYRYSAPRAVIFQSRLHEWKIVEVHDKSVS